MYYNSHVIFALHISANFNFETFGIKFSVAFCASFFLDMHANHFCHYFDTWEEKGNWARKRFPGHELYNEIGETSVNRFLACSCQILKMKTSCSASTLYTIFSFSLLFFALNYLVQILRINPLIEQRKIGNCSPLTRTRKWNFPGIKKYEEESFLSFVGTIE